MASIANDPGGRRRIQFVAGDQRRRTIRLGKVSKKSAEEICRKVERLNAAKIMRQPIDDDVARWVSELDVVLYDKLVAVGLVQKRTSLTLRTFLDSYVDTRSDVKESTTIVYGHTRRCLIDFFGADKALREITAGDADEWRIWLGEHEKLADNTVARRCGIGKQFFRAALRKGLIRQNPFADLKAGIRKNTGRHCFISREDAAKVFDACPDAQWRLLFALSRYGGLRCPSEHLALRWGDVDWARSRIRVTSPKTAHHEGKGSRWIPIFPELRPHLEAAWEAAEPDTEWVIARYRDANQNLRTTFEKIIRRAGLEPWPKLFQNLRATRETELAQTFPLHVVCEWIGNSAAIAAKHYLQVTDEHFDQAAQNPAQQTAATPRSGPQAESAAPRKTLDLPGIALPCDIVQTVGVGDTGLEPVTPSLSS
jgi:integrase